MHKKTIIHTPNSPKAIGPYSPLVQGGPFVFISGQIGIDPKTNELPEGIEKQTRQTLVNLSTLFEDAGLTCDSIVKTTIFLVNMTDFSIVNEIYGEFFHKDPPARSTIQVAGLPRRALIEIEGIAIITQEGCCE